MLRRSNGCLWKTCLIREFSPMDEFYVVADDAVDNVAIDIVLQVP